MTTAIKNNYPVDPENPVIPYRCCILLTIVSGTRDALVISPQPLLIFERHRPAVALLQIAHRVLLHCILLQLLAMEAQASQCIVELALRGLALGIFPLGSILALLPTLDESPEIVARPTKFLQHAIVDSVLVQLIGEFFEHEVGLLAGVF